MIMRIFSRRLRWDGDGIIDTQQASSCLDGTLEATQLAHCRLKHTRTQIVAHRAIQKVQTKETQRLFWVRCTGILRGRMVRAQRRNEVRAVLSRIHSESLGNNK